MPARRPAGRGGPARARDRVRVLVAAEIPMTQPDNADELSAAYARGLDAGRIEQRLQGHDEHLRRINGSIDSMTQALRSLTEELRGNVTLFSANVTAGRRDASERDRIAAVRVEEAGIVESQRTVRWTAWQRGFAVVGAIVLVVNFGLGLYLAFGR
ncbi:hypothetical protein OG598_17470 [Micromonospora sp. NBC_00330]|uniref:hypothetical protein n=1 Tax=Micromonospora sp. NBC_00330 TaxID=2903585 RepID=UPI002E2A3E29|nr:hypothetical protein [Micromonospora sp. NBC_00330]